MDYLIGMKKLLVAGFIITLLQWNFIHAEFCACSEKLVSVEISQDLVINCTGSSFSNIYWRFRKNNVKKILNSSYIVPISPSMSQLKIPSFTNDSSGCYYCRENDEPKHNTLSVTNVNNYALSELTFKCTTYNFNYTQCTWNEPKNSQQLSSWQVDYYNSKKFMRCVQESNNSNTCIILQPASQNFVYRVEYTCFRVKKIIIPIQNLTRKFSISFYRNVILDPPMNLNCESLNRRLQISWKIINLTTQTINIFHLKYRIIYYSIWNEESITYKTVSRSNTSEDNSIELQNLFPYTKYNITLSVRVEVENYFNVWSNDSNIICQTLPDVPDGKIAITSGSYQMLPTVNSSYMDVILYYKNLPLQNQNGENFHYEVLYGEKNISTKPQSTYLILKNLKTYENYTISMTAKNQQGYSNTTSSVFVSYNNYIPKPTLNHVAKYSNGTYIISWSTLSLSLTHTVFWCEAKPQNPSLPTNCSLFPGLSWMESECKRFQCSMSRTLPSPNRNQYFFAIASTLGSLSSGLVWNKCIAAAERREAPIISDLKETNVGPVSAIITWRLKCQDKYPGIKGYKMTYSNNLENISRYIEDSSANSYEIDNLLSQTLYTVWISVDTNIGEGNKTMISFRTLKKATASGSSNTLINISLGTAGGLFLVMFLLAIGFKLYKKIVIPMLHPLKNIILPYGLTTEAYLQNNLRKQNSSQDDSGYTTSEFLSSKETLSSLSTISGEKFATTIEPESTCCHVAQQQQHNNQLDTSDQLPSMALAQNSSKHHTGYLSVVDLIPTATNSDEREIGYNLENNMSVNNSLPSYVLLGQI